MKVSSEYLLLGLSFIAIGHVHAGSGETTCAIRADGQVRCFGRNWDGNCGVPISGHVGDQAGEMGENLQTVNLGVGRSAIAVETTVQFSCAILDNGLVRCWGTDQWSVLGPGTKTRIANTNGKMGSIISFGTGRIAVKLWLGERQAFVILDNGDLMGWGRSGNGELGVGDGAGVATPIKIDLGTGRTALSMAPGYWHACAIRDTSDIVCWGNNQEGPGMLGVGHTQAIGNNANEMGDNLVAVDLGTGRTAKGVAAGRHHSCAILDNNAVVCWGTNTLGSMGIGRAASIGDEGKKKWDDVGEMGDNLESIDLGYGRIPKTIHAGKHRTCVHLTTLQVVCWGDNSGGALGRGTSGSASHIGDAPGEMGNNLMEVDLGKGQVCVELIVHNYHTCAVLASGEMKCWGDNGRGQLGRGNTWDQGDNPGEMGDNLAIVDFGIGPYVATPYTFPHSSQIAAMTCIMKSGLIKCFGSNKYARCGIANKVDTNIGDEGHEMGHNLKAVPLARLAVQFSSSYEHSCALLNDDTIQCWGARYSSRLGPNGYSLHGDRGSGMGIPFSVGGAVKYVSCGRHHACVLLTSGSVVCWGNNPQGQRGMGSTDSSHNTLNTVDLGTGRTAVALTLSLYSNCALLDDAKLVCWGMNDYGQLGKGHTNSIGDGPNEMGSNLLPIDLGSLRTVKSFDVGHSFVCAILDNDSVKCWGRNGNGQLGLGHQDNMGDNPGEMGDALPVVDLGDGAIPIKITCGAQHACALLTNGKVKCWGLGVSGQLGNGDASIWIGNNPGEMGNNLVSVDLGTGRSAIDIRGFDMTTCAILNDAATSIVCWGKNSQGECGVGTSSNVGSSPGQLGYNLKAVALSPPIPTSGWCSMRPKENNVIKCWGVNTEGQLGRGNTEHLGHSPGQMGSNLQAIDFGPGRYATYFTGQSAHCAILDNNDIVCWGHNPDGRLGVGHTNNIGDNPNEMGANLEPVSLPSGRTPKSVYTCGSHTCAILDNNDLVCWGDNGFEQLGTGHTNDIGDGPNEMGDNLVPTNLGTGRYAISVDGAPWHTCAILENGDLKCWGVGNDGALGQGNTAWLGGSPSEMGDSLPVVNLGTGRTAIQVSCGWYHTCVLLDNGEVACFGKNYNGQLGLGHTDSRGGSSTHMGGNLAKVDLGTGRTAKFIRSYISSSCVILDTDEVACWGHNGYGELGIGSKEWRGDGPGEMGDSLQKVLLPPGRTAISLSLRKAFHTCADLDNGDVFCWGHNLEAGALGVGTSTTSIGDSANELGPYAKTVDFGPESLTMIESAGSTSVSTASCVLRNRVLKCFGFNGYGEVGHHIGSGGGVGDEPGEIGEHLHSVDVDRPVLSYSAGIFHGCAILDNHNIQCWGDRNSGRMGPNGFNAMHGTMYSSGMGIPFDIGTTVELACLRNNCCALSNYGIVKCWGENSNGELGQGNTVESATPLAVNLGTGRTAISISASWYTVCAILDTGVVVCWGDNEYGQLGVGDTSKRGDNPGEMGDNLLPATLPTGRSAKSIQSGYYFNCAILDNDELVCWGYGGNGRLGNGKTWWVGNTPGEMGDSLIPVDLGGGPDNVPTKVSLGRSFGCALVVSGSVKCWGSNEMGQLGRGDTVTNIGDEANEMGSNLRAVDFGSGRTAKDFQVTEYTVCAILNTAAEDVVCWGWNASGRCGIGTNHQKVGDSASELGDNFQPVNFGSHFSPWLSRPAPSSTSAMVYAGAYHSCSLTVTGQIRCWGAGGFLGIGDGEDTKYHPLNEGKRYVDVDLGKYRYAISLAQGVDGQCALLDNKKVVCFGRSDNGGLGTMLLGNVGDEPGEMGAALPIIRPPAGTAVTAVFGGGYTFCILTQPDEKFYCWGNNDKGQLGVGNMVDVVVESGTMGSDSWVKTDLGTSKFPSHVAISQYHSCARLNDGNAVCWGFNDVGQGGSGNTLWYGNSPGEMGNNLIPVAFPGGLKVAVPSSPTYATIDVGQKFSCAIMTNNEVYCWGLNENGQLGIGSTTNVGGNSGTIGSNFAKVDLGTGKWAKSICTGDHHTCAILNTDDIVCWGTNGYLRLGYPGVGGDNIIGNAGGEMGNNLVPVKLPRGRKAKMISGGYRHTCAILDNNDTVCWGSSNRGQLGIGHVHKFTNSRASFEHDLRVTCTQC